MQTIKGEVGGEGRQQGEVDRKGWKHKILEEERRRSISRVGPSADAWVNKTWRVQ